MKKLYLIFAALCWPMLLHGAQAKEETKQSASPEALAQVRVISEALEAGKNADAETAALALLSQSDPKSYDATLANLLLAQVYTGEQRYAEAVVPLQRAFDSGMLDLEGTERYGVGLAHLYMELEKRDQSLATLEKVLQVVPHPRQETYYLHAVVLLQSDRPAEAKEEAMKALRQSLTPPLEYYQLLAACSQEAGDYDTAVACIEHLVEAKPDNETYWSQLVSTQYGQGNTMGALYALERAQARGLLKDQKYRLVRIEMLNSIDRYKEAADELGKGLQDGTLPDSENLWLLWASCYDQQFDEAKAMDVLKLASERTKWSGIDMRMAERNWRAKRYDETIHNLESAWKKGGVQKPGDLWVLMASAALELHDVNKATAALDEARKYPEVADKVDRLDKFLKKLRASTDAKQDQSPTA